LLSKNELQVTLASKPGAAILIQINGKTFEIPQIAIVKPSAESVFNNGSIDKFVG
jgi:uncharacterized protein YprB with RNaseH-like and TPR domain